MTLTPEDIEHQTFKERFRGYDMQEVDAFLDRVVERMRQLTEERDRALSGAPAPDADAAGSAGRPPERPVRAPSDEDLDPDLLRRALIAAQRTADQTVGEARAEADRVLADAQAEADRVLAQAQDEASIERQRLAEEAEDLAQAVADLRRFSEDYGARVTAVIRQHLEAIERAPVPGVPEEVSDEAARLGRLQSGGWADVRPRADASASMPRSALDTDEPVGERHEG